MTKDRLLRKLFLGFVRVHILHHCAERPWYGQELIEELHEHGYDFSYGALYPILHTLEKEGLLKRTEKLVDGRWRKYYKATGSGRNVLLLARRQVHELAEELEEHDS